MTDEAKDEAQGELENVAKPKAKPKKAKPATHRAKVENAVTFAPAEYGRRFGPGELVDLSEQIAEGVTLGDIVRPDCFEPAKG